MCEALLAAEVEDLPRVLRGAAVELRVWKKSAERLVGPFVDLAGNPHRGGDADGEVHRVGRHPGPCPPPPVGQSQGRVPRPKGRRSRRPAAHPDTSVKAARASGVETSPCGQSCIPPQAERASLQSVDQEWVERRGCRGGGIPVQERVRVARVQTVNETVSDGRSERSLGRGPHSRDSWVSEPGLPARSTSLSQPRTLPHLKEVTSAPAEMRARPPG